MIYELQKIFRYNLLNKHGGVVTTTSINTRIPLKVLSRFRIPDLCKHLVELSEFNKENNKPGYYLGCPPPNIYQLCLYKYSVDEKFYQVLHVSEDGSMLYSQSNPTLISNISLTVYIEIL